MNAEDEFPVVVGKGWCAPNLIAMARIFMATLKTVVPRSGGGPNTKAKLRYFI